MNSKKIAFAMMALTCTGLSVTQAQVLKSNTDTVSYVLGKDVGNSLSRTGITIQSESFLQGVNDALQGKEALIGDEESMRIMQLAFTKAAEERTKVFREQEAAFFDTIKNKAGIQHLEDGLYYEVIEEGAGAKPSSEDEVTVHYKGSLANGKVFDDSYQRGAPLDIDLGNVIKGWQIGIPLMATGSKYRLYIPSKLGYGERGAGADIPPYSALIFEIELIGIKDQEAPL
ncbi:FKBP-type peptidyl-prolyl cis-trans isomerase [Sphingobacterium sp. FBM7-1]|mgnify:CR=1 FL=1|uniref:FKBP-type peptidyl-prolyl cis-trans isomerase n=1 Tax=Sphingobacterium sp. FBM7-1 TaxID=2886688 RepID=UPI001D123CDF|nr:FKBP-type peptidyl-prolyl cis-trans isomerase [Sphingobacterium sp. FBM7-1]MCC2597882.1 FKBP-type peptidyl-prolyl cis-trans isomerase [Sphingobacterium sp. FBM7-1]